MFFSHSAWPSFYPHGGCVSFLCIFSSVTCLKSLQYKAGPGRPFQERTKKGLAVLLGETSHDFADD